MSKTLTSNAATSRFETGPMQGRYRKRNGGERLVALTADLLTVLGDYIDERRTDIERLWAGAALEDTPEPDVPGDHAPDHLQGDINSMSFACSGGDAIG